MTNKIIENIKNNGELNKLINENNLNDKFIEDNINSFLNAKESLDKCQNCRGLYMCSQKKKGERDVLSYEGVLIKQIEYCPYYLHEQKISKTINSFIYTDIPYSLTDLSLDDLDLDNESIQGLFVEMNNLLDGIRTKGLYIYGDLGVGKTYSCIALANEFNKQNRSVAFVKANNFINEMRRIIAIDPYKFKNSMDGLKNVEILILDDIGSESVSSFSRDDILFNILDYRLANNLITIFTSNLTKEDLLKHYRYDKADNSSINRAKRLLERIDILSDDYCLTGKNRRRI